MPQDLVNPGAMVRVEQGRSLVRIFLEDSLIKVHRRQEEGGRSTDPQDLSEELGVWAQRDPATIRRQASDLGDSVSDYAAALLGDDPTATMLRSGQRLIRLGRRYGAKALAKACKIALAVDLVDARAAGEDPGQRSGAAEPSRTGSGAAGGICPARRCVCDRG